MQENSSVFVIGAGPAGLTAGYLLTKHGVSTRIIEADPDYVGGISRTANYRGFLFDIGGHRFFSQSREVVDLWHEILPDDFIERPRLSRIFYNGQYYSYPLKAFEALTQLGPIESARCVLSFLQSQAFPAEDPKTFHQWVANKFGERLFSIFFKTYTEKVWGMSCDEISADWAAQRIKDLDLAKALLNTLPPPLKRLLQRGEKKVIKTLIESFEYPRKGPGMMWEAAAAKTKEQGGELLMGHRLASLRWDAAKATWQIGVETTSGEKKVFYAQHVISSAPIKDLIGAIDPLPRCIADAEKLRYRDFITVPLIVAKRDLFPDNWIYIHEPKVKVGRIQNFRSWSPHMVPDQDLACLGLEYFCFENDNMWNMPDSELVALAKRELVTIGMVTADEVLDGCVVRQPKAYPVYDEGYKEHVTAIREEIGTLYPTLHLVGRNGMHKYNNQDHAMMTAMLTVENIRAGTLLFDVWNVNEDAEYHEASTSGAVEALKSVRQVPRRVAA